MKTMSKTRHILISSLILLCIVVGAAWPDSAFSQNADRGLLLDKDTDARGQGAVKVADPDGQELLIYQESYALVIGGSEYTNGWPSLPGVQDDIDAVTQILEEQGFQVVVHMDLDKAGIDQAFTDFISQYGQDPNNRILIYFAGHGHTVKTSYGEELGYIVPVDAPNPNYDEAAFQSKAMEMEQIKIYAKRIQSKHALFLFDACFSGALFSITRAVPEIISYKTSQPVRQFITSGSADETVPDESIFRRQFVRAMQGEADVNNDDYVTGTELGDFLQTTVVNYSENTQHPQYGKIRNPNLDKGDFVFILPSKEEEVAVPQLDAPSQTTFSLNDLTEVAKQEQEVRAAWQAQLDTMKEAFSQVNDYEKQAISKTLKIEAWDRFINAFSEDNPYSTEDDELRDSAQQQRKYWDEYVIVPTPTPISQIAFGINSVIIKDADDTPIDPVHEIYSITAGETVTIMIDIAGWDEERIEVAWTTGRGKLPPGSTKVNTYTASTPGDDYVTVYVWDRLTGKELPEFSIPLQILPEEAPKPVFRIDRIVIIDANRNVIQPVNDIYTIAKDSTVTIRVEVSHSQAHDLEFLWTTGRGKVPVSTENTNTYTATGIGGDYVIVYIWDTVTGEELLEYPISITVVP
jgi:hypothetical protein